MEWLAQVIHGLVGLNTGSAWASPAGELRIHVVLPGRADDLRHAVRVRPPRIRVYAVSA